MYKTFINNWLFCAVWLPTTLLCSPDEQSVNISKEMAQTAIWKTVSNNAMGKSNMKKR